MGLYDVDKDSEDRGSPMPNHDDKLIGGAIKSHGTNSVNYTTDASPASQAQIFGGNARLVQTGTTRVTLSGYSPYTIITSSVAHGLGYAPLVAAYLNGAKINGGGSSNIPLPLWLDTTWDTVNQGVVFQRYMSCSTDSVNVNIYTLDALGTIANTISYLVTYYLYQQTAVY